MQKNVKKHIEKIVLRIKEINKSHFAIYSVVNLIAKIIPVITTIILAELLEPSEYGIVSLILVFSTLCSSLTNYNFQQMIVRERHMATEQEFGALMSSSFILSLILSFIILAVVVLLQQMFVQVAFTQEIMITGLILGLISGRTDIYLKYLITQQQVRAYSILEYCRTGIPAIFSILLIIIFIDHAVLARVSSLMIGAIASVAVGYSITKKTIINVLPRKQTVREIFYYGTRTLPQLIANSIKNGADKIMIAGVLGVDVLGSYYLTFALCSISMIFINAMNNAYIGPCMLMYKKGDIKSLKNLRKRYVAILTLLLAICAAGIQIAPLIYWPNGFSVSEITISLLMLSFWCQGIYLLYAKYFIFFLEMAELSQVNLMCAILYAFSLLFIEQSEYALDFVAVCFFAYNFSLAAYASIRAHYAEKKIEIISSYYSK